MKVAQLLFACTLLAWCCGCDKLNAIKAAARDAIPANGIKCPTCLGDGKLKCSDRTCVNGQKDCPGPCLKLSQGVWEHLNVPGHGPNELWQRFNFADGRWTAWNQTHVGQVIEMQNGKPVNMGRCRVCGGKAKVTCDLCKGAGEVVCPTCKGAKYLPADWKPVPDKDLQYFKLKDGRTISGKITMRIGDSIHIRTAKGDDVEISASDIEK